jgi:hypothetical protein
MENILRTKPYVSKILNRIPLAPRCFIRTVSIRLKSGGSFADVSGKTTIYRVKKAKRIRAKPEKWEYCL